MISGLQIAPCCEIEGRNRGVLVSMGPRLLPIQAAPLRTPWSGIQKGTCAGKEEFRPAFRTAQRVVLRNVCELVHNERSVPPPIRSNENSVPQSQSTRRGREKVNRIASGF